MRVFTDWVNTVASLHPSYVPGPVPGAGATAYIYEQQLLLVYVNKSDTAPPIHILGKETEKTNKYTK